MGHTYIYIYIFGYKFGFSRNFATCVTHKYNDYCYGQYMYVLHTKNKYIYLYSSIARLVETGIYDRIAARYKPKYGCNGYELRGMQQPLDLDVICGVFYVLAAGLILATTSLVIENACVYFVHSKAQVTPPPKCDVTHIRTTELFSEDQLLISSNDSVKLSDLFIAAEMMAWTENYI